jgi:DNA-binding transcriptional ArsR family regulator
MKQLNPQMIERVVQRFQSLGDGNRIRLLLRLQAGPCNVTTLTEALGVAQASVSKHLAVLRQAGLVEVQRRGTQAFYRVRDDSIFELCAIVCEGIVRQARQEQADLGLDERPPPRRRRVAVV